MRELLHLLRTAINVGGGPHENAVKKNDASPKKRGNQFFLLSYHT